MKLNVIQFISFVITLILIITFFPSYPIYGYVHEISSGNNGLLITITHSTLVNVLKDNFYDLSIKILYVLIFSLQLLTLIINLIFIISRFSKNNKINFIYYIFLLSTTVILELLLIIAFKNLFPIILIPIICFILSTILLSLVLRRRNKLT